MQFTIDDSMNAVIQRVTPSLVVVRSGRMGAGAGTIWRQDGLVLTNFHVVSHAHHFQVQLSDRREYPASLLAADPEADLALLKIDASNLPTAMISDSRALRVGQLVFAVGHPWGQVGYVTGGIISALGTYQTRSGRILPFIRSDARLAPGNSGGPLVNAAGSVIGINAMVIGGDQGVAVASQTASVFIEKALAEAQIPQSQPIHTY